MNFTNVVLSIVGVRGTLTSGDDESIPTASNPTHKRYEYRVI
jgi:hypothetical protein